jgi:hypothetical protein
VLLREADVDVRLRRLGTGTVSVVPRCGFGDRVMRAIAEVEPWLLLGRVARGMLAPLLLLVLLIFVWTASAREVVGAAYASSADPLELSW